MAQSLQQLSGAANVASTEGAEPARRPWSEALISYAQSFEDVLLQRAFANVAKGFYVDIGAFSPIAGSITKIFYDRGWSGINIEPGSIFETLRHERPRDINLNIAILDHAGMVEFLEDEGDPALSHIKGPADPQPGADRHRVRNIRCERLDHVLAEHAAGRLINFIKIDAEGAEELIIRSTDWRKIRPQVLVIEAVAPWTNDLVSQGWEPALLSAGYTRAYFDGINLFFVAEEHADLLRHFDRPVNAVDLFERYDPLKDKAVAILAAFNLLSLGVATRLDRVSARTRGVPEGTAAHVEPSIPQLVREFDAALTLVSRFDGAAQQLSQLLQKRHDMMVFGLRSSSGATQARLPNPDPDQLLRELDGAIAAAIRCERIVMRLEDPGGPRSLGARAGHQEAWRAREPDTDPGAAAVSCGRHQDQARLRLEDGQESLVESWADDPGIRAVSVASGRATDARVHAGAASSRGRKLGCRETRDRGGSAPAACCAGGGATLAATRAKHRSPAADHGGPIVARVAPGGDSRPAFCCWQKNPREAASSKAEPPAACLTVRRPQVYLWR
jgi:FkbM family methyltransferase